MPSHSFDVFKCVNPVCRKLNACVRCKGCKAVFYCSNGCRKRHAGQHERACKVMRLQPEGGPEVEMTFEDAAVIMGVSASMACYFWNAGPTGVVDAVMEKTTAEWIHNARLLKPDSRVVYKEWTGQALPRGVHCY